MTPISAAPPDAPHIRVVFAALMLVVLLAAVDISIVNTALPSIVGDLGGFDQLAWITTAYLLAQTAVTPLYGKLGDLYGRKRLLQIAVVVFLLGSALCGLAQDMTQLVVFRAVQGIGGGGLMVLTQAVIGDIIPARERATYQALFGSVFGLASVAGPLLGGFFVEQASWRWIFYVNVPLGAVALAVLAIALPHTARRSRPAIDYLGAALLIAGLSGLTLVTSLVGTRWSWSSAPALALTAAAVAALAAFALVERRAPEPVMPPMLARNRVFVVAAALSALVGCLLLTVVVFTPLYFQTVHRDSPTMSGLRLIAMMVGILAAGLASGRVISRTGRYKIFPIAGTATMAAALLLLSRLDVDTGTGELSAYLLVFGLGMGLTGQILVLAVQNAVPYGVLGTATSGVTLARGIGSSLGPAALGALFGSRLTASGAPTDLSPDELARLSSAARFAYEHAFVDAIRPVFLASAGVAAVGLVLAWRLEERPLRRTAAASTGPEDTFAAPRSADSLAEIERALATHTTREERRRFHERLWQRAGLELSPGATWALVRIANFGFPGAEELARHDGVPEERIGAVVDELSDRGLVSDVAGELHLTDDGRTVAARAVAARAEMLEDALADEDAERRPEVHALLQRLAVELAGERP